MPQTTTLRRVSTFVVGTLFAVVFICSGASAAQAASTHGDSAVGAHTVASKAAVRAVESTNFGIKHQVPLPLDLAATGTSGVDNPPEFVIVVVGETPSSGNSRTLFTTSERAPPAF